MNKKEYYEKYQVYPERKKIVDSDKYRCQFHLMAPIGWLNDPNGLVQFNGVNHLYFQYSPFSATWGMKLWGHYSTKNWIEYEAHEPFLFPDTVYDRDGTYSGCATVVDDKIHFFYTGNVKYTDKQYDYIYAGREQNVIEVISKDGFHYDEKICRITNKEYPQDMSVHVRDPKVFQYDNIWYMILGGRTNDDVGCALLYRSFDLKQWEFHIQITTPKRFGYMWECCDLIQINHKWFLMCCPQGVKQEGINYANVYQIGYFPIEINFDTKTYQLGSFFELDRGFDIYAPQSYIDENNRCILLAWMGIPDAEYTNPTIENHWQHALTLPRVLSEKNNRIIQTPILELQKLRKEKQEGISKSIKFALNTYEFKADFKDLNYLNIQIANDVAFTFENNICSLKLDKSGYGRDVRKVEIDSLTQLHIFVDTSAIEIFINGGVETFTTRFYPDNTNFEITANVDFNYKYWELDQYCIIDSHPSIQKS